MEKNIVCMLKDNQSLAQQALEVTYNDGYYNINLYVLDILEQAETIAKDSQITQSKKPLFEYYRMLKRNLSHNQVVRDKTYRGFSQRNPRKAIKIVTRVELQNEPEEHIEVDLRSVVKVPDITVSFMKQSNPDIKNETIANLDILRQQNDNIQGKGKEKRKHPDGRGWTTGEEMIRVGRIFTERAIKKFANQDHKKLIPIPLLSLKGQASNDELSLWNPKGTWHEGKRQKERLLFAAITKDPGVAYNLKQLLYAFKENDRAILYSKKEMADIGENLTKLFYPTVK